MTSNTLKQNVDEGLEALRVGMQPYVYKKMLDRYGEDWMRFASGTRGERDKENLDAYALLKSILNNWHDIFRYDESLRVKRSYVSIAMEARNCIAHFRGELEHRQALRYLDAIREILTAVGADKQIEVVNSLYDRVIAEVGSTSLVSSQNLGLDEPSSPKQLRPWRTVCEPHTDVLDVRFSDAEFAANLAQVDIGEGSQEYTDPNAFFRITYITEGLRQILSEAILRLSGKGGNSVIGLQTNFGGGKTHAMLALYHLAGLSEAGYSPEDIPDLAEIFSDVGIEELGQVKRVVFVGSSEGVSEAMHREGDRRIDTLWGYIAWRLGGWDAFESIKESEIAGTNPGSKRLIPILRDAAPCMILLDEVVLFARQLRDLKYDAFHAFVQSLTEAATAVDGVVVVGSLPASKAEVGDEQGIDALNRLEKLFGRVQSTWLPADGAETFEIVRSRLFGPLDEEDERARDDTIQAFRKLYRDNKADFPAEVQDPKYEEEMRRTYPIHPEVLRCFSGTWSTLERFQRTRNVLKIMANVVFTLWSGESSAPLILPSMLPFRDPKVRAALLEPLDKAFAPILQSEVDGDQSLSAKIEASRKRFQEVHAATRAARAVFFATAPLAHTSFGGMTGNALRLACTQPGDQISIFSDALQEMATRAAHLYRDGDSYWYSPIPTLNQLAEVKKQGISSETVDEHIVSILRQEQKNRGGFSRVHASPDSVVDIDDQRSAALVILSPSAVHASDGKSPSHAECLARDTIERRGNALRRYRNSLIFVAADASHIDKVREYVRYELAWQSILEDNEIRPNLTETQIKDAETQAERCRVVSLQGMRWAWVHVLYPIPRTSNVNDSLETSGFAIGLTRITNRGSAKSIPQAVWDKATSDDLVIDDLGPIYLVNALMPIWPQDRQHVEIEEVRNWFASYPYLPRLRDDATLDKALQKLIEEVIGKFAFATTYDNTNDAYKGVVYAKTVSVGDFSSGLLVRRETVQSDRTNPQSDESSDNSRVPTGPTLEPDGPVIIEPVRTPHPKRFVATFSINEERAGLDVAHIMDGILVELTRHSGNKIRISLEVDGSAGADGYPENVVDTVLANLRDMSLKNAKFGFEDE